MVAQHLGMRNIGIAEYPGVILTDSKEELQKKVEDVLVGNIIKALTTPISEEKVEPVEPSPKDVVFEGTLDDVQEFFNDNLWTDGLPIIPPTIERVEKFLRFTDRSPDEVIGVLVPENRQATVWNIAVNGVMAGCRPEYMPILIAVIEAIADPEFRLEDAGSTPGWEPLITLNGTIIKELDFNCGSGVMRVGRQANTSVGRFLRLYMRNVPGSRIPPGGTDKGTIAQTFNVVLAENEDAVTELGWETYGVDRGFKQGENIVTVRSVLFSSPPTYSAGTSAEEHLETITEVIGRRTASYWTGVSAHFAKSHPLLVMSPCVAKVIAKSGWKKDDIKKYLYQGAKTQAGMLEKFAWQAGLSNFSFSAAVKEGKVSKVYCESTDPNRMVPVFFGPEWIDIVVSGDSARNQSKGYINNQMQGPPISKKIGMPKNWEKIRHG